MKINNFLTYAMLNLATLNHQMRESKIKTTFKFVYRLFFPSQYPVTVVILWMDRMECATSFTTAIWSLLRQLKIAFHCISFEQNN
jgi:hypothetical protein